MCGCVRVGVVALTFSPAKIRTRIENDPGVFRENFDQFEVRPRFIKFLEAFVYFEVVYQSEVIRKVSHSLLLVRFVRIVYVSLFKITLVRF